MPKLRIASLLFALLAGFSTLASAAEAPAPAAEAPAPAAKPPVAQAQAEAPPTKVDLNSADSQTLARELHGVGEAKARAIVDYREANGAFTSVDELLEVKGIGTAILERNRERLVAN